MINTYLVICILTYRFQCIWIIFRHLRSGIWSHTTRKSSPISRTYTIKATKRYVSTNTATHGSYRNLSLNVVTFKTSTSFGFSKASPKETAKGFLTTGSLNYFCFLSYTNNIEHNNMIDTCALIIFMQNHLTTSNQYAFCY